MKILNQENDTNVKTCNCIKKDKCPLNKECLTKNIIYQATINTNGSEEEGKVYIGQTETIFKKRFANHLKSFNQKKYKNDTELSNEYWRIKELGHTPTITWNILRKCNSYNQTTKKCNLCLSEKLEIIMYKSNNLLNKRSELTSKCRHLNKFTLKHFDTKD